MISINFSALLYLLASILFIMSLKGLSSPTSARKGNYFGILGMTVAIITTILQPETSNYSLIITAILIGGVIGTTIALKIEMTAMPSLKKGKCSFVIDSQGEVEEMRIDIPNPDFDFTELEFKKIQ